MTWPTSPVPRLPGRGEVVRLRDASGEVRLSAEGPAAGMYVCGITPYDSTHMGHVATYVAFDVLRRAWLDAGLKVRVTSNVTDVDDPLLERAHATGVSWEHLAAEHEARFARDMAALSVLPPDTYLRVSDVVPQVAEAVAAMLDAGAAYRVPTAGVGGPDVEGLGDVYADLAADPAFGSVSGLDDATMRALFAERGGDPDRPGKRGPLDPLLWRRERPGEPAWDGGRLGRGRPGWHVECAVIAAQGLGPSFDVQAGGSDLLFPHHEMSCSHTRMLYGGRVRVHAHAGMVAYAGHKMSKSLGNLVLVGDLEHIDPAAVRLTVLAAHYSSDWEWTDARLTTGQARLARWRAATARTSGPAAAPLLDQVRAALARDLDTPAALEALDTWVATDGDDHDAPALVRALTDALLGVRL